MIHVDANKVNFEKFRIFSQDALFSCLRINPATLPNNVYAYEMQDCDDCSRNPCILQTHVTDNHWCTVIVKTPIDGADSGIPITNNDYEHTGKITSLKEFLKN